MSKQQDLLLEIGCEEIPTSFILPALSRMETLFKEFCEQNRISHGEVKTYATPRRLTLIAREVSDSQAEKITEIKGPPASAALDAQGKFTPAAAKFAASRGGSVKALQVKNTEKGDYLFLVLKEKGGPSSKALKDLPAALITRINFPKNMRWDVRQVRFARPVRWIMLLFGDKPVKVDFENIPSGAFTFGNRYFGDKKIKIESIADYFAKLEAAGVIVDHERRREMIRSAVTSLAGGKPHLTSDLLNDVNFLVEYPYPAVGSFAPEFTELPKDVLIICIEKNQHYFPVEDPGTGRMLPKFVAILNAPLQDSPKVISGYEKVLLSRLKDAKFFYDEDLKIPLPERVPSLARITFQEKLGSLLDKTERVEKLILKLGGHCGATVEQIKTAERAARLMKADLTTQMVFEYTEIQGSVGATYALHSGEPEPVAQAIGEHYLPRFAEDVLAESVPGALVALADKCDTIAGYFAVGMIPSGSADPYQLRRQAIGVLRTLEKHSFGLSLDTLFNTVLGNLPEDVVRDKAAGIKNDLFDFFAARFGNYMESAGFSYDIVNAVDLRNTPSVSDAVKIAAALTDARADSRFAALLEVFTRISNIMSKSAKDESGFGERPDPALFESDAERALFDAADGVEKADFPGREWSARLSDLFAFCEPAQKFFDGVMVMAENPAVRTNRLSLLNFVRTLCLKTADFKKIVKAG